MSETMLRVEGVLVTDPFPYSSVEEPQEVYLAKFQPGAELTVGDLTVTDLYLNLGSDLPELRAGDQVAVTGHLAERKMPTRSGKIRRGGIYQLFVKEWSR